MRQRHGRAEQRAFRSPRGRPPGRQGAAVALPRALPWRCLRVTAEGRDVRALPRSGCHEVPGVLST